MTEAPHRTIASATYTPSSERNDDANWLLGDVTYVRFEECSHVMLGNPAMHYRVGSTCPCRDCLKESA